MLEVFVGKILSLSSYNRLTFFFKIETMSKDKTVKKSTAMIPLDKDKSMEIAVMNKAIWRRKGRRFYAFSKPDENGKHSVMELNMTGTVVNCFLRAGALSHTVVIEVSKEDIEGLKSFIGTVPEFEEEHYGWPFTGNTIKFTCKKDLDSAFKYVWNGVDVKNWRNIEERKQVTTEEVKVGKRVIIEYTPMPYVGRNGTSEVEGFQSGCSLELLSIGILGEMGSQEFDFDFESPRKRRRIAD